MKKINWTIIIFGFLYVLVCYLAKDVFDNMSRDPEAFKAPQGDTNAILDFEIVIAAQMLCYGLSLLFRMEEYPSAFLRCIGVPLLYLIPTIITLAVDYFILYLAFNNSEAWIFLGIGWFILCGWAVTNVSEENNQVYMSGLGISYSIHLYLKEYGEYYEKIGRIKDKVRTYLKFAKY